LPDDIEYFVSNSLIQKIKTSFTERFFTEPIIIQSPGRINIIGEHTDYNDGFVLPAAINKNIVAAFEKSDSAFGEVVALDLDESCKFSPGNINPKPDGGWQNYVFGVVSELHQMGRQIGGFNLVFGGDIPKGAGLSSSAALENSIVFGLNELFHLNLSRREMIHISQRSEQNFAGVKCGIMDQFASMYGRKNKAIFLDCRSLKAEFIEMDFAGFEIILIDTGVKHRLAESSYNERRKTCEKIAKLLNVKALRDLSEDDLRALISQVSAVEYQKALYVIEENERVIKAAETIRDKNIEDLGKLLFQSHQGLRNQYKVSCAELDYLVERAKENEAVVGARMVGAGFGGCTINLVKKEKMFDFSSSIKASFKESFGKECDIYNIELSGGTERV
jgi:galactokinase